MPDIHLTALALLNSVAAEQNALGEILNAQSEFLKKGLSLNDLDLCKLLELNESVVLTIEAAAKMEEILKGKMEFVVNTFLDTPTPLPASEETDG